MTSPKDIFLHLLAVIALYVSAASFVSLIFSFINIFFPDALNGYYETTAAYDSIRWSVAALIVIFPVYIATTWFLNKSYFAEPSKRNLRIRKWLIYFTLFAAAVIIIGDLVSLIYNLLGGEFAIRFLLKTMTIFFMAGSIFIYYFLDIRKYKTE